MGQKVNPHIQRIGIIKTWNSRWYANKKNYAKFLHQDLSLKKEIEKFLDDCGVSKIEILRNSNNITINIYTSKPGLIIGRQGSGLDKLKDVLNKKYNEHFSINIAEIKRPDLDAKLVAENIAKQIEKRVSYRRSAKLAVAKTMEAGAKGIKILVSGRLNGVEIARQEYFTEGKIPLQTFRADIDYHHLPAQTTYGAIGVKVWIYKGDVFKKDLMRIEEKTIKENQ
ncbi:30S ribosomal protein S3 [Candidatus Peregrinibacteria bacterium RIFOXYC2_FULL_33_13]|nr:MAG: 30S ribosomal protein S3 [Candidatus Peregrinibacteria bacterium GW2011_GWA2_33_10]KKP40749.1 MAG: 30S ribosomal protein S3, small subunit ribosomal protein S3 [Candidatus Peregrinibacteria bacterium GW2011_GWC2_33_13]OGJ55448.1 MAG: 30S ribosomal protein S3 [Candidatus Peregrinibacteria bacterium RIFOXYC2_FULL_33_13]